MYIKAHICSQLSINIIALLLFLYSLFTNFCIVNEAMAEEKSPTTHVVIINSYHQGFKWTDEITSAVISKMSSQLNNLEFHVEYMDSKRHPDKEFRDIFYRSIAPKYKSFRPDIIITSDDNALDFVKRYHRDLFPATPVIFCGVNKISNALSVERNYFSGLIETLDIVANIELIQHLMPEIKEIVIVSDGTTTGLGTRQMVLEVENQHQDIDFTYLNGEDLNTEQMLESLKQLGRFSAVLVPAWYLDKDGNTFDNTTIYPLIVKASAVPVFATSSANLGLGIVGGKLNSGIIQGEYAAYQALRILFGEVSIKDLPVETNSQNKFMFDHFQLSRFGISKQNLPPGSIIFNRPIPFYERYKTESGIAFSAFILLVSIIALLLWNIRRRQMVEKDLVDQKQMAEQYFNIAGVMLIVIDSQSRIVLVNRKTLETLGYAEKELLGEEWMKICLVPSEYNKAQRIYKDLMDGKVQSYECIEQYALTKQGKERLIAWKNVLLKDRGGNVTGILTSGEDITERSNMEKSLRESEERFRALHEASFGGIVIHDEGRILDCNQGLSEITGYSIDELIGMDGLQLIEPGWREVVMQNISSAVDQPYEVEGIRRDNSVYALYLRGKNIPYKGRTVRVVEFRDITDRKLAEEERIKLESQLHQAQKMESIGQLAGGVAHDFNNMLAGISGAAELLEITLDGNEDGLSYIGIIRNATERASGLTSKLLAFSRKGKLRSTPLDLHAIVRDTMAILERSVDKRIALRANLEAKEFMVVGDPSQLQSGILNICLNARDVMPEGGEILVSTANVEMNEKDCSNNLDFTPGMYIKLSIEDTGTGILPELQPKIFEPFFTTKEAGKGTGLGLAAVYGMIKEHHGNIQLYSEPGKGTVFHVFLPVTHREVIRNEHKDEITLEGSGTILVVDDEDIIRATASLLIENLGYDVILASNGKEAVEIYDRMSDEIDLIIIDMVMPVMDGREAFERIISINPAAKMIMSSGYAKNINVESMKDKGLAGFIAKPFNQLELSKVIADVLNRP